MRHVAGDVPAVAHDLGGLLGHFVVALHHVGALDQQHARLAHAQVLARFEVDDLGADAGDRHADGALRSQRPVPSTARLGGMLTETTGDSSVVP